MADYTRTGHSIFRTVRASLKLASTSSELISIADLSVLRDELQATLAVVKGQIQSEEYENHMALVDMTGWDDSSDEKKKTKKEEAGTAVAGSEDGGEPSSVQIPGPYSADIPDLDELPDHWYVVIRGPEVGIFTGTNNECFNRGVDRYQVKVNTWAEAVKLYNECYNSGNVVRISI